MRVIPTTLDGVVLVEPAMHADARGAFFEAWRADRYAAAGLPGGFVQCNVSRSARGVLRGLHLQHPYGQGKLVSVLHGSVFDVAVDVRRGSPAFGRWFGVELSGDTGRQLYVPVGFAHGFLSLSEALVMYQTTELYQAAAELVIRWDDPTIGVMWPRTPGLLSERDRAAPTLDQLRPRLPSLEP